MGNGAGRVGRKEDIERDGVEGAYNAVEPLCVVRVLRCVILCGVVRAWGAVYQYGVVEA